jgi:uncharacterized protein (UPF0276 family)
MLPGVPSLIEWDNEIPEFSVLQSEAARASRIAGGAGGYLNRTSAAARGAV